MASPELLGEYESVLFRPKFGFPTAPVAALLDEIRSAATIVEPAPGLPPALVSDPHDLMVLATAVAGAARYLVTGNARHFPASHRGVAIVTPRRFMEAWIAGTR